MAKERILMRVTKGALVPADSISEARLRGRNYAIGDRVFVELKKPRNPGFHRRAHALGMLVTENLDTFESLDAHEALKRLQLEAGVGCDHMQIKLKGEWVDVRIPQSLSYESMDQARFEEVYEGMCDHLARQYWSDCSMEQIQEMAELMRDQLLCTATSP